MVYEIKDMTAVVDIFDGWNETLIWSCIQGVMGHIYANHINHPTSAMAILGDFVFYAGVPSKEIIGYKPDWCKQDFIMKFLHENHKFGSAKLASVGFRRHFFNCSSKG